MESKIFKFKEYDFRMIDDDLLLKKKSNRLLQKYFELEEEFTGNIDTTIVDNYEARIAELETALEQAEDKTDLTLKLDKIKKKFESDLKVKSILRRKEKCNGLILKELIGDTDFIKPLFEDILSGEVDKLDYEDPAIDLFIMEVITDFFSYTANRRVK